MKRWACFLVLVLTAPVWAQEWKPPEIPFHFVPDFVKLPDKIYFGEVVGVALDSKGNIYVANRGLHPLIELNPDGTFMRTIGEGFVNFDVPHSVRIDAQDNIWYVDAGADIVVEFNQQARLLMVLGRRPEPWTWLTHGIRDAIPAPWLFYQPTNVDFGADGSIYVTDGYGNSRVAKFNSDGNLVKYWGDRGTGPGQFHTPHAIVLDSKGTLYVGDRENHRIHLFDADGKYLSEWTGMGAPWGMCITPGPSQIIYSADGISGRFYKINLQGKTLGAFGTPGKGQHQFGWVHSIACPSEDVIYAAEEINYRLDKLMIEPAR